MATSRPAKCCLLALHLLLFMCIIPSDVSSASYTDVPIDKVLITELQGLPLIEQQNTTLSRVTVKVGTTNDVNVLSYPGPYQFMYSLTDSENMNPLVLSTDNSPDALSPGQLYTFSKENLVVSLTGHSCESARYLCVEIVTQEPGIRLTENTTGCIEILCRGVVITYVEPALNEIAYMKQGDPSNSFSLTVSFTPDPNTLYASVEGPDLWDPYVFANGNQFGTVEPKVDGVNVNASLVMQYGISNTGISIWPKLTLEIDASSYGCPEVSYLCVNPRRYASSSVDFSLTFIPPRAMYGCVEVVCYGVEFESGTLTTTSSFAEFKSDHMLQFTASFMSNSTRGGVRGNNLWKIKVYATSSDQTGNTTSNVLSSAYADISVSERDMDITAGDSLMINNREVVLDLSALQCTDLLYLCAVAERDPASMRDIGGALDFSVTSYTVCTQIECIGSVLDNLIIAQSPPPNDEFPLKELTTGNQFVHVDVTMVSNPESGSVSGSDLWQFDVFLSSSAACETSELTGTIVNGLAAAQANTDLLSGETVTIELIEVAFNMTEVTCQAARYLCVNVSLSASALATRQDVSGDTSSSTLYDCTGVQVTDASITVTSPSPLDITERGVAEIDLTLTVEASADGGSALGDNLWTADVFFSPFSNGSVSTVSTNVVQMGWSSEDLTAGSTIALSPILGNLTLSATCAQLRYLCVQLRENAAAVPDITLHYNALIPCVEIPMDQCHGVEFAETNLIIANSNSFVVIENTATDITAELNVEGMATATSAPIGGTGDENLWSMVIFSSSDGVSKDGAINFMPTLSPLQKETEIQTNMAFDFTPAAGIGSIPAVFNMDGKPCDQNAYMCVEILVGDSPIPEFSLTGNTTGCMTLDCKGVIVTETSNTITQIPNGGVLVEGFPAQEVDLLVNVSTDAAAASALGTGLWQLHVFTNAFENGSSAVRQFEDTLTTGAWVDTDITAGATVALSVAVMVDLSTTRCEGVNYLCVELQEGVSPSRDFSLMYQTGPENLLGCAPVTCETAGIQANGMSFSPQKIVEHQAVPEPFVISVSYISQPGRDNITGTNLWQLGVFFSDSENGTNPTPTMNISLGSLADAPFYSGETLNFTDLSVAIGLADVVCFEQATYLCTQLAKGDPLNTEYTLEIRPVCQQIECDGVILTAVDLTVTSGSLLREFESSQSVSLDVVLHSAPEGANISGSHLWDLTVFLSNSNSSFDNMLAQEINQSYTPTTSSLTAGVPFTLTTDSLMLDLDMVGCVDFMFICVTVTVGAGATPMFNIHPEPATGNTGCTMIDCQGVIIMGGSLVLTTGSPLIERMENHVLEFNASLEFGAQSANVGGNALWEAHIFTNTAPLGTGDTCVSSPAVILEGNVTQGQTVNLEGGSTSLNISSCSCAQMPYLCMRIIKNPGASVNFTLQQPTEGLTICVEVMCSGVVISGIELNIVPDVILYEAVETKQNVTGNVVLNVSSTSAEIIQGDVTNIWQLALFPRSDEARDDIAMLTTDQKNQGVNASAEISFTDLFFDLGLYNFVCPADGVEELCVRVSTDPAISPPISIGFDPTDIACVNVTCRGVILSNLTVLADTNTNFIEFESMHQISFNFTADTASDSTNIAAGVNLFAARVYGSMYANGSVGDRYSETVIQIHDQAASVTAGQPVAYDNLTWSLDLTNFTCPQSNLFYMCMELVRGDGRTPDFSITVLPSGEPLLSCAPVECTGVLVDMLDLGVNQGNILVERNSNDVNLTVTVSSSSSGSSINGDGLWRVTLLLCELDNCVSSSGRRRRATNPNALLEQNVTLSTADVSLDLSAGGSITFSNIITTFDLTSYEMCPANGQIFICVQLEKGSSPQPDFTLSGDLLTCQQVECRGVHIAVSSLLNPEGSLQEGRELNPVELDLTLTTDLVSATISGTGLWDVWVFGSNTTDGSDTPSGYELGEIGSTTNAPLGLGETVEFVSVTANLNLSVYETCRDNKYVCGRLVRRENSAQAFSVTGQTTACALFPCTGVLSSATTVEILNGGSPVENEVTELTLNISLTIDPSSSWLQDVADGWMIDVTGNPLSSGIGTGTQVFVANTSMVGGVGAKPGTVTVLENVPVSFDLSDAFCEIVNFICVYVHRGMDAMPSFTLGGLPANIDGLYGCTAVECIGVRINNSSLNAIEHGNPILEGESAFYIEVDVDFYSDVTGASVDGTNIFGVQIFLSPNETGAEVFGSKYPATIPEASQNTALIAGQQLNIPRANATISTEGDICSEGNVYVCAELVRPSGTNVTYLLTGYDPDTMAIDASRLIGCIAVECRDVRIDDAQLNLISAGNVLERTANQVLSANLTVSPNATWGSVSGNDLWQMTAYLKDGGQMIGPAPAMVVLSTENRDRDLTAGVNETFPDVELALDLSSFYCPADTVQLCVAIQPSTNPSTHFSISASSVTEACVDVVCRVTEIEDSGLQLYFPTNLIEFESNALRLGVDLTASDVSAAAVGQGLWKVVRIFISNDMDGTTAMASTTPEPLNQQQDDVDIEAGQTVRVDNVEATLDLATVTCSDFGYLCVEVAKGDSPSPDFNVTFINGSNIVCQANDNCKGIVITASELDNVTNADPLDIAEREDQQVQILDLVVAHDPAFGTSTGSNQMPWSVLVSLNEDSECPAGSTLGESVEATYTPPGALVDGQDLIFTPMSADLTLTDTVCPTKDMFLCVELANSGDFTLEFDPPETRYAVAPVNCHGVEFTSVELTLTDGVQHEQYEASHLVVYDLVANSSSTTTSVDGSRLWNLAFFGSRNSDGSGTRVINQDTAPGEVVNSIAADMMYTFSSGDNIRLSFEDVPCVDMPYLCVELQRGSDPSLNFSLFGIPDQSSLISCAALDCRGVYIDEFNVSVTPAEPVVSENNDNSLSDVSLSLSSLPEKENATGTMLWQIWAFFNSDSQGLGSEKIAETQIPISGSEADQDFLAGGEISFDPLDTIINLNHTCDGVNYLCFELRPDGAAVTPELPVLLGMTVSCVAVECRGVIVAQTVLDVDVASNSFTETMEPINLGATVTVTPHSDSADISGTGLWNLEFYLSDSSSGDTVYAQAPPINRMDPLSRGSNTVFAGLSPVFNATEVLCYEALYLCVQITKGSEAAPDFGLAGKPNDSSLIGCALVNCKGVVVAATTLTFINNPILLSGDPSFELALLSFSSTFASDTREMPTENSDLFRIGFRAADIAEDATSGVALGTVDVGGAATVVGGGTLTEPVQSLIVDLTGVRCDQMRFVCGVLEKGNNPNPDFTLQGQGNDDTLLFDCVELECRGVQINNMFVQFVSGVPLLEDATSHEVNFTLELSSEAGGANAAGNDLWSLTAFLSRYANGSDPISPTAVAIGDDANTDLPAGGSVSLTASVNLNASDLVCDVELFLCVDLAKGAAVAPDYTLEGAAGFADLRVCQPYSCRGVNLTTPMLSFPADLALHEFNEESEITVNVSVDVTADSATVSGTDLWHLEFFTSNDSSGIGSPSPRTVVDTLDNAQGSVSLVADQTSSILDVNAVLNLRGLSCDHALFLCVEVWRGQGASPFYTINSPASHADLRVCQPIMCVGVELLGVIPSVVDPPIWIEDLPNQLVSLSIELMPDPMKAGIVGDDLFDVTVWASASDTGNDASISSVSGQVPNNIESNRMIDRINGTTLTNVQATLDFSGVRCSDIMYVCVRVVTGPSANPAYTLGGSESAHVGCMPQSCGGVVVTNVEPTPPNLNPWEVLEGDSSHTFVIDVTATTWTSGVMTPGVDAWQLEVFVSNFSDGSNPLVTVTTDPLTAPAQPDGQIDFSAIPVTLNLSSLACSDFGFLCTRLTTDPSANFSLVSYPADQESVLLGCNAVACEPMSTLIQVDSYTDTTLTVSWQSSIGDFDTYRLSLSPGDTVYDQIRSVTPNQHTFTGLTPGETYTTTLQLWESNVQKGIDAAHAPQTLLPACPSIVISQITSREFNLDLMRPDGYATVSSFVVMISPSGGITPSVPLTVTNPFTDQTDLFSQAFTSLVAATTYTVTVTANGNSGDMNRADCTTNTEIITTNPGSVALSADAATTTTVDLSWTVPDATPTGFRLTTTALSQMDDTTSVLIPGGNTSYQATGLMPGTEYEFGLEMYVNVSGQPIYGDADTVTRQTVPAPPVNVVVDVTETTADITYQAPEGMHTKFTYMLLDDSSNTITDLPTQETTDFIISYTDLSIGTEYVFQILTNSGTLNSELVSVRFTTRPSPPGVPYTETVDTMSIGIRWAHSSGPRDHYEVTYSPNSTAYSPQTPHNVVENTFVLTGLDPYTTIDFYVRTVVNDVSSTATEWRQRSFATRPDPVQDLTIVTTSPSSVNVIFDVPERPNGLISGYLIVYTGQQGTNTNNGNLLFSDVHPNDVRVEVPISSLNPGFTYIFSVQAVNEEGTSDPVTHTTVLQAGDPVPSGQSVDSNSNSISTTATTISIVITDQLFSDLNGDVIAFEVFVVDARITDRTISDPPLKYQDVSNDAIRRPYVTSTLFAPTPFTGRRKRQIADTRTVYTIGAESPCLSETEVCNGPLESLTSYRVLVRAYTDGGFSDSPWSEPITTRAQDAWFTIPVIIYGIVIFIILLIMLLCCLSAGRHRLKRVKSAPGPRKTRGFQESRFNDNHNNSAHHPVKLQKGSSTVLSRPILSAQFGQHYSEMVADKQHKFSLEFDALRSVGQENSKSQGREKENGNKNRFGNILPYNKTRVHLSGSEDYINASYVTGFNGEKEYIATQGPMSNTVNDFWRMVWERKSPYIVMLVRCIEGGKEKCDKYWPMGEDPTVYGKVIVKKLAEHTHDNWAVRDFQLKVGTEERLVRQFNFVAWPTHNTPRVSQPFLNFVQNVRDAVKPSSESGPIVVHCGAGIGRTGVFIAMDTLLQEMKADQRTVDVFAVVARMRKERCNMVQSLVQYIFLHRAIADFIQGQGHVTEISSLERSDAGSVDSGEVDQMSNTSL